MGARSLYNYNSDPKVKELIDADAVSLTNQIEQIYSVVGPTQTLLEAIKFYLIHKTFIIVKTIVNGDNTFSIMHPELDDIKLSMEPIPTLTLVRYLPLSQKEEKLLIGDDRFKFYEGSIADINFSELLTFIGYTGLSI